MSYSKEGIRELCLDVDRILIDGDKYNDKVTSIEDLQNRLRRKAKFKEIDFQSKCEGDNSLGDLLLKHATENNNPRVKDFLLQMGMNPFNRRQITAAINKEEEGQNTPDVEENRADSNEVDSSNFINLGMTAKMRYEQLIQGKETNHAIFDSFANAVRESNITGDRGVFLDVVKLFTDLDPVIHLTDTASRTILGIAAITKQADVVKVLLGSGKFSEEEKFNALRSAIVQGNVQEFEVFLDYVDHASIQEHLNAAPCNENTDIMKVLLDNKKFTEGEKVDALSNACIDGDSSKVRLLLKHMTGIPEDGIRNLLEMIKESKLSLEKELKIDSEFKGNPNNPDHRKYFSNLAIIKLLESAINGDNRNHDNEIPVVTEEINNGQAAMPSNERETKYKENFYTSLTKDAVGVVITGLFITAAVMVPFVAGAIVCGIIAALVAIYTGLHIKNSTLPSYREMEENKVEHVNSQVVKI